MAQLIKDDDHVSSAEDMSELLDDDVGDDMVIVDGNNARLELAGFEDITIENGVSITNDEQPNPTKPLSARQKTLFKHPWVEYFRSFEDVFLRRSDSAEVLAGVREDLLKARLKQHNPHRNVCWSILATNISEDPVRWKEQVRKKRHEYEVYKTSYLKDERRNAQLDPGVNNPLSQDANSPWTRFFADNELKQEIERVTILVSVILESDLIASFPLSRTSFVPFPATYCSGRSGFGR
jgi:hypothetical protein